MPMLDAYLALATGCSMCYHCRVRYILSKVKEGPAAGEVTVVQPHFGGEDLCVGAQQGAIITTLTLDPSTKNVSANHSKASAYIRKHFYHFTEIRSGDFW